MIESPSLALLKSLDLWPLSPTSSLIWPCPVDSFLFPPGSDSCECEILDFALKCSICHITSAGMVCSYLSSRKNFRRISPGSKSSSLNTPHTFLTKASTFGVLLICHGGLFKKGKQTPRMSGSYMLVG